MPSSVYDPHLAFEGEYDLEGEVGPVACTVRALLDESPMRIVQVSGASTDPDGETLLIDEKRGKIRFTLARDEDASSSPGVRRGLVERLGGPYPFVASRLRLGIDRRDGPLVALLQMQLASTAIAYGKGRERVANTFVEGDHGDVGSTKVPSSLLGRFRADAPVFMSRLRSGEKLALTLRYRPFAALRLAAAPALVGLSVLLLDLAAAAAAGPGWSRNPLVLLGMLVAHTAGATTLAALPGGATTRSLLGTAKVATWVFLGLSLLVLRGLLAAPPPWAVDAVFIAFGAYIAWATLVAVWPYAFQHEAARRSRALNLSVALAFAGWLAACVAWSLLGRHLTLTDVVESTLGLA